MNSMRHTTKARVSRREINTFELTPEFDFLNHSIVIGGVIHDKGHNLGQNVSTRLYSLEDCLYTSYQSILLQSLPNGSSHVDARMLADKLTKIN